MDKKKSDKLRKQIKTLGVPAIADASGVPLSTLYTFLNKPAANLRGDNLLKTIEAIEFLNGDTQVESAPLGETTLSVPIFDIRASAGVGALVEDGEPTGYQPYRESELFRYNLADLAVIQVGGDSMWETLHDGDKVLVNRAERRIVKPGIYILGYEETLLVKRCQRNLETGAVIVQSDNEAYDTFTVSDPDKLEVFGRVVWIGRALG